MKSLIGVIAPTSIRLDFNFMSQINGATVLPVGGAFFFAIGVGASPFYQVLNLINYTVDVNGVINVTDMHLNLITLNDSNTNSRLQVSGDGGTTWVDVTDDIPGDGVNNFVRKGPGQWLSNIQIGTNKFAIRILGRTFDGNPGIIRFRSDSSISVVYNKITTGAPLSSPQFPLTLGRGFTTGGRNAAGTNIGTTERFDDVANAWTSRIDITARSLIAAYSFFMTDFGFTSGGFNGVLLNTTERFDDIANTITGIATVTTRADFSGFAISLPLKPLPDMYGYTTCGITSIAPIIDVGTTERYDNIANTQTGRLDNPNARRLLACYSLFGCGFASCGTSGSTPAGDTGVTNRLNDVANTWTTRQAATVLVGRAGYNIDQFNLGSFGSTFRPLGYATGGNTTGGPVTGITERFDDITNVQDVRASIIPHFLLAGFSMLGFGFASCGLDVNLIADNFCQRFDDFSNTQTSRTGATTARHRLAGYSLEELFIFYPPPVGHGFTSCGNSSLVSSPIVTGITQRFDDTTNLQINRAPATARRNLAGYSFNNFGFTSCGFITANVGTTEQFDDTANTHTLRADASARRSLTGYSFNNFGFTSCGFTTVVVGTTERFDNTANTHTARTSATARRGPAGYSLNGFGFTSCGFFPPGPGDVGLTEKFDDTANTQTVRASATARTVPAGYSMLGFGFTSCGNDDSTGLASGVTERFDDTANTQTARATAIARVAPGGYSFNNFGFTSCGTLSSVFVGTTQKFDDIGNTHTLRTNAYGRDAPVGYNI